jgi:hypothetical protein
MEENTEKARDAIFLRRTVLYVQVFWSVLYLRHNQSMEEPARRFNIEGLSPGAILELITLINAALTTQTTEGSTKCQTHQGRRGENRDEESQAAPNYRSSSHPQ